VCIHQSLLGNLAVTIVLLGGAIMTLTFIGSRATVERLSGKRFGTGRVIDVVTRHHEDRAAELMSAPRRVVARFTGGVPADDDRTAVIVKRD
jgi:hypothetical protein